MKTVEIAPLKVVLLPPPEKSYPSGLNKEQEQKSLEQERAYQKAEMERRWNGTLWSENDKVKP